MFAGVAGPLLRGRSAPDPRRATLARPFNPTDGSSQADEQFDPVPSLARRPVPARRPPRRSSACRTASRADLRRAPRGSVRRGESGFPLTDQRFCVPLRAGRVFFIGRALVPVQGISRLPTVRAARAVLARASRAGASLQPASAWTAWGVGRYARARTGAWGPSRPEKSRSDPGGGSRSAATQGIRRTTGRGGIPTTRRSKSSGREAMPVASAWMTPTLTYRARRSAAPGKGPSRNNG